MTEKFIDDIRNGLDSGKVTSDKLFEEAVNKAYKYQDVYNSFVTISGSSERQSLFLKSSIRYVLLSDAIFFSHLILSIILHPPQNGSIYVVIPFSSILS